MKPRLELSALLRRALLLAYFTRRFGFGERQRSILGHYFRRQRWHPHDDIVSLRAAIRWITSAHDSCGRNGVSTKYSLKDGWDLAYPETSGYIIPSLYTYGEVYRDQACIDRAIAIGDWEIDIQTSSGGVLSNLRQKMTRIFNTGQVLLGWCFLYEKTHAHRYQAAALRAADYLCSRQEGDGRWVRDTYCGSRTYHARVDWALLRAAQVSGKRHYIQSAVKNLLWVLSQQQANGWFDQCGFNQDPPNMHVIAYTLQGLLECEQLNLSLGIPEIASLELLPRVEQAAVVLCEIALSRPLFGISGMLPSSFDSAWQSSDRDTCLTGNLQLACVLYRLHAITGRDCYVHTADLILKAVKSTQLVDTGLNAIDGGITGSYPIYSGYLSLSYPNWAAKFFVDAIMMKHHQSHGITLSA